METFVVRLWVPGNGESTPDGALRGTVIHVVSGRSVAFHDDSGLLEFVRDATQRQPGAVATDVEA